MRSRPPPTFKTRAHNALHNLIDEGAYTDLKALHGELDEAVAAAYGWPEAVAPRSDGLYIRRLMPSKIEFFMTRHTLVGAV